MPKRKRAKDPKINLLEKFNKVRFLQNLGLLSRQFNYETLEFEKSWLLRLVFYLSLISKPLFSFKQVVGLFWPKNDVRQLYVGSVFNYLADQPKFFLGIGVSI